MAVVLSGMRFVDSVRINEIVNDLSGEVVKNRPLTFIDRLPVVDAYDDEIRGRFTGRVWAADIVADDQPAPVYEAGALELTTNAIPNLKVGQRLGQNALNRLYKLEQGEVGVEGENAWADWEVQMAENLITGVRQRMNYLACAMFLDTMVVDRLGIKLTGSWQTPAGNKVTVSTPWSTAASATPITDIFTVVNTVRETYGIELNRITLSRTNFLEMVATTQFANLASLQLGAGFNLTSSNLSTQNDTAMKEIAGKLLNMEIVLEDGTFYQQTPEGVRMTYRYLPQDKVIIDRKEHDNDASVYDFAQGVVTETIVDGLVNGGSSFGSGQYGPVAYYTGNADLNPPNLIAWGVARGFPRKHVPEANCVLTV